MSAQQLAEQGWIKEPGGIWRHPTPIEVPDAELDALRRAAGQEPTPCGTTAAKNRHRRHRETCSVCRTGVGFGRGYRGPRA